jgi:hypothetical protein
MRPANELRKISLDKTQTFESCMADFDKKALCAAKDGWTCASHEVNPAIFERVKKCLLDLGYRTGTTMGGNKITIYW